MADPRPAPGDDAPLPPLPSVRCPECNSPRLRTQLRLAHATYFVCEDCEVVFGVRDTPHAGDR